MASGSQIARKERALRRIAGRSLAGLRTAPYLHKWLVLGSMIGVVAGLGAIVFYGALELGTHYLLGVLGGFYPAGTAGEGGFHLASGFSRPWAIPLVVALGGLLSGILVFGFAPEAEGHGTDAAIEAVHHKPKGMRARVTVIKIVASALTIGSGGSGGREGPTAQISATFGSMMARVLNLSLADSRIAVSAGIASGIGAIFRAPLGGALLGAELIYRDDIEASALVPSLVASIVAFAIFGSVSGFTPMFGYQTWYTFSPVELVWYAVLGLLAGALGRLYAVTFYGFTDAFKRFRLHPMLKPGLAGLLVGLIGLAIPGALNTGYGSVQEVLDRNILLGMPLWLVLLLPFAKIVATSLSIGSGGSGGIFGPGMVIGGAVGAALWRLLVPFAPAIPHSPVPFVIIGMISCFGSVAHAPLAVMLMVAEMTGNLALLAPAMIAIAAAVLVVGDTTIYRSQLRDRNESPAYRLQFGMNITSVPVREVMALPQLVLNAATSVASALEQLAVRNLPGAPVVDPDGVFIGTVRRTTLEETVTQGKEPEPVGRQVDGSAFTIAADGSLEDAVEALAGNPDSWLAVLDSDMHVVGIMSVPDVVRGYRTALEDAMHRLGGMAQGSTLLNLRIAGESLLAGQAVAALNLPRGTVLVTLHRQNALLFVGGDTVLQADDQVSVLARPENEARLRALFAPDQPAEA